MLKYIMKNLYIHYFHDKNNLYHWVKTMLNALLVKYMFSEQVRHLFLSSMMKPIRLSIYYFF